MAGGERLLNDAPRRETPGDDVVKAADERLRLFPVGRVAGLHAVRRGGTGTDATPNVLSSQPVLQSNPHGSVPVPRRESAARSCSLPCFAPKA